MVVYRPAERSERSAGFRTSPCDVLSREVEHRDDRCSFSLGEKLVVELDGETSNQLFETLAKWNTMLMDGSYDRGSSP